MKRILIALAAGGAIFGTVFAFAAALSVSSNDLAAGDATVEGCGTGGTASYTTSYSPSPAAGYVVNTVEVTGLPANCEGQTASATLTGTVGTSCVASPSGTASLAEGSDLVSVAGTATITFTSPPLACNVVHIYVVVATTP